MWPRQVMIDNSGHKESSETEFRVYSYFVWMSNEITKVCPSALSWQPGAAFKLTFWLSVGPQRPHCLLHFFLNPRQQHRSQRLPPKGDTSLRGSPRKNPPGPSLSNISLHMGEEDRVFGTQSCHHTGHGSTYVSPAANAASGTREARGDGVGLQPPLFYPCHLSVPP